MEMEVEGESSAENHKVSKRLGLTTTIQASFGVPDDPDYVFDIAARMTIQSLISKENTIKHTDNNIRQHQ